MSSRFLASLFKLFLNPGNCPMVAICYEVETWGPATLLMVLIRWAFAWEIPFGFCRMFVIFSSRIRFSLSISV